MKTQITLSVKQFAILNTWSKNYNLDGFWSWYHGYPLTESQKQKVQAVKSLMTRDSRPDNIADKKPGKYLEMKRAFLKMSKIQRWKYQNLSRISKDFYLSSFRNKSRRVHIYKFTRPEKFESKVQRYLKELYDPFSTKRPFNKDLGEWIGVEIECYIDRDAISGDGMSDESCHIQLGSLFVASRLKYVSIKSDGSINCDDDDNQFAVELTVFFKRSDMSPLERLCKVLNNLGAEVNKSCGLHVHLDCRDIQDSINSVNSRAKRLGNALPVLSQLVPQSRLSNTYCRLGVSRIDGERYYAINKTAFKKYKTIEIRLHSSTTSFKKISEWALLLFSISRETSLTNNECHCLDELLELVQAKDSSIDHFMKRASLFSNQSNEEAA